MKRPFETIIQLPVLKTFETTDKRIEFHKRKIIPQRVNILNDDIACENEWQQEYFIIYNSYVLDDKEQDN